MLRICFRDFHRKVMASDSFNEFWEILVLSWLTLMMFLLQEWQLENA